GRPTHYRIRHRDGRIRWFASYGTIISDARGRSTRWIGIDCDITDYKEAEVRARHVQAQLQLLADTLPELIAFVDDRNIIQSCNAALSDWLDANAVELAGRSMTAVMDEQASATLAPCAEAALQGTAMNC